jgi:flagellar motor switch protein FliG
MASAPAADKTALSGLEKIAILLVTMGEERAAHVLKRLKPAQVEKVVAEIGRMSPVPAARRQQVVREFLSLMDAGREIREGGWDYARSALEKAMGESRAALILNQVERPRQDGFGALDAADPNSLVNLLVREHPQTVALILTQMHPEKSAQILARLPETLRPEVTARIAAIEKVQGDVLSDLKEVIASGLGEVLNAGGGRVESGGGPETAAAILNLMDKKLGSATLETLAEVDPELVQEIRNKMFVFEDIRLLDDRGVQRLLKEVETKTLAVALRASSSEAKELIFRNMSQRAADLLKEEMELMGPVRLSQVEEAQKAIVEAVRRLEEDGEIVVSGRGGGSEDSLIV